MKFSKSTRAETDFEWLYTDWQGKAMIRLGSDKKKQWQRQIQSVQLKVAKSKRCLILDAMCPMYAIQFACILVVPPEFQRWFSPSVAASQFVPDFSGIRVTALLSPWQPSAQGTRATVTPRLDHCSPDSRSSRSAFACTLHSHCILQKLRSSILKQVFSNLGVGF